jgi:small subunit ribosomal protein S6
VEELEEGPSAMLQSRGREDRPRRFDDRPRRYEDRGPRHEPVVQAEPVAVEE